MEGHGWSWKGVEGRGPRGEGRGPRRGVLGDVRELAALEERLSGEGHLNQELQRRKVANKSLGRAVAKVEDVAHVERPVGRGGVGLEEDEKGGGETKEDRSDYSTKESEHMAFQGVLERAIRVLGASSQHAMRWVVDFDRTSTHGYR